MPTWNSHSQSNHGFPLTVAENGSARGIAPCATIHSPVFKCQNVSDSEILSSARTNGKARANATMIPEVILRSFPCIGGALSPTSFRNSTRKASLLGQQSHGHDDRATKATRVRPTLSLAE